MRQTLRHLRGLGRLNPFDTSTEAGRSQERYRLILLTTTSGLAVRGVGVLVSLVTVPLVLSYLGKERYGLWTAVTTLVAWAALFDFGLANGLVNLVARAHGRDDTTEATRAFSAAVGALSAVALLLAAMAAVAIPLVSWSTILGVRGEVDGDTVRWSVAAALGMFLVGLPLSAVPQLYAGYQKTYLTNAFTLLGSLGGLGLLVAAVSFRASMPVLVVALSSTGIIAAGAGLVYARRAFPWVTLRGAGATRDTLRALTARSLPIFLYQVGALAVNQTQVVILAHRTGLATVTNFSIAFRMYALLVTLIIFGTASFVPTFREAAERGEHGWARRAFRRLMAIRIGLAGAGGVGMMLLGNEALRLWLRRSDIVYGWQTWLVVSALVVTAVWVTTYVDFMLIMDRLWPVVGLVLANGAVTITLTWLLTPRFDVLGAFVALLAFSGLVNTWLVPWMARSLLLAGSGKQVVSTSTPAGGVDG
jgi:O-antigen/teichoic acid export membrane protein